MIDGRVKLGLFGQLVKPLFHAVLITQRLVQAECVDAKLKDVLEILVGGTG